MIFRAASLMSLCPLFKPKRRVLIDAALSLRKCPKSTQLTSFRLFSASSARSRASASIVSSCLRASARACVASVSADAALSSAAASRAAASALRALADARSSKVSRFTFW